MGTLLTFLRVGTFCGWARQCANPADVGDDKEIKSLSEFFSNLPDHSIVAFTTCAVWMDWPILSWV